MKHHPGDFRKIRTKSLRTCRMWGSSHALLKLAFRLCNQPKAVEQSSGGPLTTKHPNWKNKTGAARRDESDPRVLQLNSQAEIRARRRLHFRRQIAGMIKGSEHFVIRAATTKTHQRGATKQEVNRVELQCGGGQVSLNVHDASELGLDTAVFPEKADPPMHHPDVAYAPKLNLEHRCTVQMAWLHISTQGSALQHLKSPQSPTCSHHALRRPHTYTLEQRRKLSWQH